MTTLLSDIFEKPVDRAIDGVIKADDEASLRVELDEYVITGEIGQRLEQFLEAYNNYDTSNGVVDLWLLRIGEVSSIEDARASSREPRSRRKAFL